MIPIQKDFRTVDDILLFGIIRKGDILNTQPLENDEIEKLCELIKILQVFWLKNIESKIGGNWGLIAHQFQSRNGIIIYQQFQRLKRQRTVQYISNLEEAFLREIETLEPDSNQFIQRCKKLNLDPQQIMKVGSTVQNENKLHFQLGERIFDQDQYVSDPGSLASDILEQFSYEEYVTVRSVWSQRSIEEQKIDIPEAVRARMNKRTFKKKNYFNGENDSHDLPYYLCPDFPNKDETLKKAKMASYKKQAKLMLKHTDKTNKKIKTRKFTRIKSNRKTSKISKDPKHSTRQNLFSNNFIANQEESSVQSIRNHYNDQDQFQIKQRKQNKKHNREKQLKKKKLKNKRQKQSILNFAQKQSNTYSNAQNFEDPIIEQQTIIKPKRVFSKLTINRIELNNLTHHRIFPDDVSKQYLQIQQQIKRVTNQNKIIKVLKNIFNLYLSDISKIKPVSILYLKMVSDSFSVLPNSRALLKDFITYLMTIQFAKLVGEVTYYIVDQSYDERDIIGIVLQVFKGFLVLAEKEQFDQIVKEMTLAKLIDEFLEDCFSESDAKPRQNSYFTMKSSKVIYNLVFESSNSVIQPLVACRLVEKVLYSKGLFQNESSIQQPLSTNIKVYKKYLQKLTPAQLDNTLKLFTDIEQVYPTFITLNQFKSFLDLVDYKSRPLTVHIEKYIRQCVHMFIKQQLRSNSNQPKSLLNQIIRQTFLGEIKKREEISYWHIIYLTAIETMFEFPVFQNASIYKQIFLQVDTMKITPTSFKPMAKFVIDCFNFTVKSQRETFEKEFQRKNDVKLIQCKELTKLKSMYLEKLEEEERHFEFKVSRGNTQHSVFESVQMYQTFFSHSPVPQIFALKLKFLLEDKKLTQILHKRNPSWKEVIYCLTNTILNFLLRPDVQFKEQNSNQTENINSLDANSDSDDTQLQKLLFKQAKYKNYYNFILNIIAQQWKSFDRSLLNTLSSIEIKDKELILSEFQFNGCKVAFKVIVGKTCFSQIVKVYDNAYSSFDFLLQQCGEGSNFLFSYKVLEGSLKTFIAWFAYKKVLFQGDYFRQICCCILNLSLVDCLQKQRDNLIDLHIEALNLQVNKFDFWTEFANQYRLQQNPSSKIHVYIQSLIKVHADLSFLSYYLNKYQKQIQKARLTTSQPINFSLFILDLINSTLYIKHDKYPDKFDLLLNLILVKSAYDKQSYFLKDYMYNKLIISKLSKLLILLIQRSANNKTLRQYVLKLIKTKLQKQCQSLNIAQNQNYQGLNSNEQSYFERLIEVCEYNYSQNKVEFNYQQYQQMFGLILDQLKGYEGIKGKDKDVVFDQILNRMVNKSEIFKSYFSDYRVKRVQEKYSNHV